MTKDKDFKKVVRRRARKTGESYAAAKAKLEQAAAPPEPQPNFYPFERFTDRAKKVLTLAQAEAEAAHHTYIGTEHLLLGLILETEGLAWAVLRRCEVDFWRVRTAINAVLGEAKPKIVSSTVFPTTRVKRVIELAFEETRTQGVQFVGTEHLLLGLLMEGEGIGARVLNDMGVDENVVRLHLNALGGSDPGPDRDYGSLAPLMADARVSAIAVNGPDQVWVQMADKAVRTNIRLAEDELRRLIEMAAQSPAAKRNQVEIRSNWHGVRFHATLSPAVTHPVVTITKVP